VRNTQYKSHHSFFAAFEQSECLFKFSRGLVCSTGFISCWDPLFIQVVFEKSWFIRTDIVCRVRV